MPIQNGRYVAPQWYNGTSPAINAAELQDISDTLECVPIANGGTGATTAAGIRNALGLGNTTGAIPIASGGTGATTAAAARNNLGLGNTAGALPIANGGTGQTSVAAARNALGLGNTTGAVPIANGGTGATTAAAARNNLGLGNTAGALPIANGGTGQTTAAGIRNTLGLGNTTGALPVANGGSGMASVAHYQDVAEGWGAIHLYKWGPVVMLTFVADTRSDTFSQPGAIPAAYRPARNQHAVVACYASVSATGDATLKCYGNAFVRSNNGDLYVETQNFVSACPRFTMVWLTA